MLLLLLLLLLQLPLLCRAYWPVLRANMPVAPLPMSVYTRLHDPVAHAKSEEEAKQVCGACACSRAGAAG